MKSFNVKFSVNIIAVVLTAMVSCTVYGVNRRIDHRRDENFIERNSLFGLRRFGNDYVVILMSMYNTAFTIPSHMLLYNGEKEAPSKDIFQI